MAGPVSTSRVRTSRYLQQGRDFAVFGIGGRQLHAEQAQACCDGAVLGFEVVAIACANLGHAPGIEFANGPNLAGFTALTHDLVAGQIEVRGDCEERVCVGCTPPRPGAIFTSWVTSKVL